MLEITRVTRFEPGTNQRWDVAGANWTFCLPSLALGRVVCLGAPSPAARRTLERLARELVVVDPRDASSTTAAAHAPDSRPAGDALPSSDAADPLLLALSRADLAYLVDGVLARRFVADAAWRDALLKAMPATGALYVETWGRRPPSGWHAPAPIPGARTLWLTPLGGEMHTAVPVEDARSIRFMLAEGLYSLSSPVLKQQVAARLRGRTRARGAGGARGASGAREAGRSTPNATEGPDHAAASAGPVNDGRPSVASDTTGRSRRPGWSTLRRAGRALALALRRSVERGERALLVRGWLPQRYGCLVDRPAADGPWPPPAYLRGLAAGGGWDLEGWRWALSARGAYSSRKVLFFLFEDGGGSGGGDRGNGGDRPPDLIAKMTRDPGLNARLENEWAALEALAARGIGDRTTLPRVVFKGHHAGLAIVGETAIQGRPFRAATDWSATCPHARAAVDWLVALGGGSAEAKSGAAAEAGAVLGDLLCRFEALYRPDPALRAFLAEQIAALSGHPAPFPTVFQHGDPGTWNLVATPDGRTAFLDWEAAEARGMPLWDLFYFLRSFAVGAARAAGTADALAGFRSVFLQPSELTGFVRDGVARGREACGLAPDLVEPLFFACWMHRALKEATRTAPRDLGRAHYATLLALCHAERESSALRRILGVDAGTLERSAG